MDEKHLNSLLVRLKKGITELEPKTSKQKRENQDQNDENNHRKIPKYALPPGIVLPV